MSSNVTYANQAPGAVGVDPNHPAAAHPEILDADQAIIRVTPTRKKIAICGFAASTRNLAPWDDLEYEIWGLNQLYRHIPRVDRMFDIHRNWREDNVEGTDHPGWLAQCGVPVYMVDREPLVPTSVRYPLERMINKVTGVDYFTSTVAFMLALAIWELDEQIEGEMERLPADDPVMGDIRKMRRWLSDRYMEREIGIFGIDLVVGTEYEYQKQCVEYLLGLANARGITIRIPPQAALLKQLWRYGYEIEPAQWPVKKREIDKRLEALQNERMQLMARIHTVDGAMQEAGYWQQVTDLRVKGAAVRLNEDT